MMKSESDLMRRIDDKFQKLLSQFEMNMNILEKSKRQQTSDLPKEGDVADIKVEGVPEIKIKESGQTKLKSNNRIQDINSTIVNTEIRIGSVKDRKETGSERSEATIKENEHPKPKKQETSEEKIDDLHIKDDVMGDVLKYVSECADMQNKKKKRKKTISFNNQNDSVNYQESDDNKSLSVATGSKKSKKKKSAWMFDGLSAGSSKKRSNRSNCDVVKKPSKTVTNISKKVKRRTLRVINTGKDWVAFNRSNAGKMLRTPKNTPAVKTADEPKKRSYVDKLKAKSKKEKITDPPPENLIDQYDTIENKLISDFIQNDVPNKISNKAKNRINSASKKSNERDKFSFRSTTPLKHISIINNNNEINKLKNNIPQKNNIDANKKNGVLKKVQLFAGSNKLAATRSLVNNSSNPKNEVRYSNVIDYMDKDKENIITNSEGGRSLIDRYSRDKNDLKSFYDINRARSEIKMSNYALGKENEGENGENELEMDELFREIPFVVGRSISRTFNLGLSFQHAMSMLRRIHSKKEVKEVLSIGCPDNAVLTETMHCSGLGTCEAMFSPDWTKEDEEAWEENPWDPDLNRRRPKCTCLPNNCTTLKNVLKQLSNRNPNFNTKSLTSLSCTAQKLESEIDMLKRPNLQRAKSQSRTELLRNIRTIQIQLTPPTEIFK